MCVFLTFFGGRVGVSEEPEAAFVVPVDYGRIASHLNVRLATLLWSLGIDQHRLRKTCAIALPGAQQPAAVDACRRENVQQKKVNNPSLEKVENEYSASAFRFTFEC